MRTPGIEMEEAVKIGAIPKMLLDAIFDVDASCECGAPLEFDETMRILRCSDEHCKCSLLGEAKRGLRFLGVTEDELEGLTPALNRLVEGEEITAGCMILTARDEEVEAVIEKYLDDDLRLDEILAVTGVKVLTHASKSIMRGFRSVGEMYTDIDRNGLISIIRRLSIEDKVELAYVIKEELERVRVPITEIERRLNVIVRKDSSLHLAGNNFSAYDYIGVATDENAEVLGGHSNSELYNKLVESVSNQRVKKGLSAIKQI